MVIFPFLFIPFVPFTFLYLVIFLFGYPVPLRKKDTGAQVGSGENHQAKASVDHVSTFTEGAESSIELK